MRDTRPSAGGRGWEEATSTAGSPAEEGDEPVAGDDKATHGSVAPRVVSMVVACALAVAAGGYYLTADPTAEVRAAAAGASGSAADALADDVTGTGPGLSKPGIDLRVTPLAEGGLEVVETVRLRQAEDQVRLRPPDVSRAGPDHADLSPTATDVRLTVDGRPSEVPDEVGKAGLSIFLPTGTAAYSLRYVLRGTSAADPAGGTRAAVGPLSQAGPAGRVMVRASGPSVSALTCPLLPRGAERCAVATDDGVELRRALRGRSALVLVAITEPAS